MEIVLLKFARPVNAASESHVRAYRHQKYSSETQKVVVGSRDDNVPQKVAVNNNVFRSENGTTPIHSIPRMETGTTPIRYHLHLEERVYEANVHTVSVRRKTSSGSSKSVQLLIHTKRYVKNNSNRTVRYVSSFFRASNSKDHAFEIF